MSIELFFLNNLLADFALVSLAARSLGCFRLRRALPLSILAAGYGLLSALHPPLAQPFIQALLLAAAGVWLTGGPSAVLTPPCLLALTASALLAGGITGYLPASLPFTVRVGSGICLGGGIVGCIAGHRRYAGSGPILVQAGMDGRSVSFPALIDTGNRLREPLSGQPVLIVRDARIRSILPRSGYRQVAFGSEPLFNLSKNAETGGAANAVDAITGATMTSKGLNDALNVWFKAYEKHFTDNAKAEEE